MERIEIRLIDENSTSPLVIDLEKEGIKVNAVSPGYTKTALNGFTGTETLEEGAAETVRVALLGAEGPNGTFTHATMRSPGSGSGASACATASSHAGR